jgi:hypothetical protein
VSAICYDCGLAAAGNDYAGTFSAYCSDCQPVIPMRKLNSGSCECASCAVIFGGVTLFDAHRTGTFSRRRCRVPERMGLLQNAGGVWHTPEGLADAQRQAQSIARARSGRRLEAA